MIQENYIKLYEKAFRDLWTLPAISNYSSPQVYSYADVARCIARVHLQLEGLGIGQSDKVALIAKDSAEWCMVYMGVMTYGATVVPILPDFHTEDIHNIIVHSEAKAVYSADSHLEALQAEKMPEVRAIIDIPTLKPSFVSSQYKDSHALQSIEEAFKEKYPSGFGVDDVRYREIPNDRVLVLNYTSGTTGFSKGVMLTGNNLAGNVLFALQEKMMRKNEKILCFLPLAHAYSCAFNFLTPLVVGMQIIIFNTLPTPSVLSKAFAEVRPELIMSVPLIFEKIYKQKIHPKLEKPLIKLLLKVPFVNRAIYDKIRDQLYEGMGGNFRQVIIGGAAMNDEICEFMHRIRFPFTVGYGMTECGPLISYVDWSRYVPGSCGKAIEGFMEARIDYDVERADREIGEIQVRGENVCLGYYKNPEATEKLFTKDGWMHTGDLGYIDDAGNIFIKGRNKTMLLGPSGQNIYPEEIETRINMLPYISDSLVIQNNKARLIALVYPDHAALKAAGLTSEEQIAQVMEDNRKQLNTLVSAYEKVVAFRVMSDDFERTPKKSIKRYLYQDVQ